MKGDARLADGLEALADDLPKVVDELRASQFDEEDRATLADILHQFAIDLRVSVVDPPASELRPPVDLIDIAATIGVHLGIAGWPEGT